MRGIILLVVLFTLCLCACQKDQKQANTSQTVTNQTTTEENNGNNQSYDYKKMSEEISSKMKKLNSFYDGTWHTSENIISTPNTECEFGDNGEICELIGKGFGDCDKIVVKGDSGKIMYQMNLKKFEKNNHLKDNYFYVLKDSFIEMYSMEDGRMSQTIDIGNLAANQYYGKLYEFDEEENEYTSIDNCYNDIKLTVEKDVVYIGTCSGVYKWKEGEKVFHKILDAGNTKYYKKMIGTIKVARDGTIYCLGTSKPHLGEHYESGSDELLVLSN